ncbi:MAG: hypothetical protein AAF334_01075 [Pseudomonadota bacterium]
MRLLIALLIIATAACRPIYTRDIANLTSFNNPEFPPAGTYEAALIAWFDERGYLPGPKVHQTEGELRRMQGEPLVYASPDDKEWWFSRAHNVRDFCITQKLIYYRLDTQRRLARAVQTYRSEC